jgi:hypothetical protein
LAGFGQSPRWSLGRAIFRVKCNEWSLKWSILTTFAPEWDLHSVVWNLHSVVWNLHSVVWNLHSAEWNLHSVVWSLHSDVWSLHSDVWSLHSDVWSLHSDVWAAHSSEWKCPRASPGPPEGLRDRGPTVCAAEGKRYRPARPVPRARRRKVPGQDQNLARAAPRWCQIVSLAGQHRHPG